MAENFKPLKERVLEKAVANVYEELIKTNGPARSRKIFLYGLKQEALVRAMVMLYDKMRFHNIKIYTEKVLEAQAVRVALGCEELAFLCKEDFYSQEEKKRRRSIVVRGGDYFKRQDLQRRIVPLVDVFVCTQEQFPNPIDEYVIDLDELGYYSDTS